MGGTYTTQGNKGRRIDWCLDKQNIVILFLDIYVKFIWKNQKIIPFKSNNQKRYIENGSKLINS